VGWYFIVYCFCFVQSSCKLRCVLCGSYVDEFERLLDSACEGLPIIILQFVRVSKYDGNYVFCPCFPSWVFDLCVSFLLIGGCPMVVLYLFC
jgi:hypothetical protein